MYAPEYDGILGLNPISSLKNSSFIGNFKEQGLIDNLMFSFESLPGIEGLSILTLGGYSENNAK